MTEQQVHTSRWDETLLAGLHDHVTDSVRLVVPDSRIAEPGDWHLPLGSGPRGCPDATP